MNPPIRSRAGRLVVPCLALIFTSPIWRPTAIEAQGCGSCAAASGSYQDWGDGNMGLGSAFPTLNEQFGGSEAPRTVRLTNTGVQTVAVNTQGTTTTLTGPETKYADASGTGGEDQGLPGEPDSTEATTTDDNGTSPGPDDAVKKEDSNGPSCEVDSAGNQEPAESTTPTPAEGGTNSTGGQPDPQPGDADSGGAAPAPSTPAAPSSPATRSSPTSQEYQGTAFQSGPGGVIPLTNNGGGLYGAQDAPPEVMVAASLGKGAGYLVPKPKAQRGTYGSGNPAFIGPERIGYYMARGSAAATFYNGLSTTVPTPAPITNDLRWHSSDGLTTLTQVTSDKARIDVYNTNDYDAGATGYPLYSGVTARRSTTIERLTTGNPNAGLYTTGYQVRTAISGFPAKLETTWTSNVVPSGSNQLIYSLISRALEGIPGSSTHATVSTRVGPSLDRIIDLTTTEVVQQPAYNLVAPLTQTIVVRSKEKRRLFPWGEETIEATTYLTPSATGASLTASTHWYDVPQSDANFARPRLKIAPDGRWEAFFRGVPDAGATSSGPFRAGSITGWKNTAAPTAVTTAAGVAALASTAGYSASLTSTKFGQHPLRTERYENGVLTAKSEDLTAHLSTRRTLKRYANTSTFFITVITSYSSGAVQDVFQLKENQVPADLNADPDLSQVFAWRHSSNGLPGGYTTTVDDALHLPSTGSNVSINMDTKQLVSMDRLMVSSINPDGSPSYMDALSTENWLYDDRGRPTFHYKDGEIMEWWVYPSEYVVDYTDASGIRHWMEYEPQGRLVRDVIMPVAALAISDMPGSPTLNAAVLGNYYTTEWLYRAPTVAGSVSNTVKLVTSKTSVTGSPQGVGSWRREWTEHIDGLARPVSKLDPLGTVKNFAYVHGSGGTDITTSLPGGLGTTTSIYLSGQKKSTIYSVHPVISTLGKAGSDVHYDYSAALYASTIMAGYYSTFTLANGYEARTTDGLGRIIATLKPTGMNGASLNMHTEVRTYDPQNRLASRSLPGATAGHYEVYYYPDTPGSSYRYIYKAKSTDNTWHSGDPSQSVMETGYYYEDFWYSFETFAHGGDYDYNRYTLTALGGFSSAPEYTSQGTWTLTGVSKKYDNGEMVTRRHYALPGTALTRTRRYVDGNLRLSITSYNGLPLLYDTNGTTYSSKIASYSVLRDALSYVDPTSGYWPYRAVTAATGLTTVDYLPGGTIKSYTFWFPGSDYRAGLPSSRYSYVTPGAYTYYDYNARGQRIRVWGGESPAQTTYDDLGRMKYLSTYRAGSGWTGSTWPAATGPADTTEWTYPPSTSLQLSKIYPDAGGTPLQDTARRTVGYSYHPNGSLATRTWQRMPDNFSNTAAGAGVITIYRYDPYARLQTVDYPAASATVAATPDVGFTYDAAGRISTRTEAGQATTTYLYMPWGAPWKETVASLNPTAIASSEIERTFDGNNRLDLLKAKSGATIAPDVNYDFFDAEGSSAGMLQRISSDGRTITYGYNGTADQPSTLTSAHGATTLLSTTRSFNSNGLVDGMSHVEGATLLQSYTYGFSVDRVTTATHGHEGSMSWNYRHDARGQVTSGDKKFLTGGEFAAGLQTEYAYDMAGNRTSKGQGGSAGAVEGTGVRPTTYAAANALNQYSSITHPSSGGTTWIDVAGQRSSSLETIKVNATVAAYQQDPVNGLSFRREVTVSPNTHNTLTVTSTIGGATTTLDTGYVFVPLTAETLTYDADGNLRSDGRWLYTWDAENRLKTLSKQNPASAPNYTWTYTFLYDGLSRRIGTKIDWYFTPGLSYYFTEYDAFVFDDWNLVMSGKNSSGSISSGTRLSYVWGPDIGSNPSGHGSWQKAGGVGGLVAVLSPTDTNRMLPLMDRLGNVTGYRKAVSGTAATLSAVFEYDAFGREVRSSGPVSDAMRFRFSTKYHHGGPYTETDAGLVYYGYRFYDPDRGRWVNRDPIGEKGGRNLYGMVKNSPPNFIDVLGRDISSPDIRDFMEPNPTEGGPHNGYEPSGYPPGKGASDYLPSEQNPWPPLPPCSKRDCNRDCLLVAAALSYANAEGAAKNPAYRPFAPRVQCAIAVGAAACLYSCSFCENP